jgi:hypothetical protein
MTITQFKKTIENLNQSDLQDLLVNLFQRSTDVKQLSAAYFGKLDDKQVYDTLLEKIDKCFRKNGIPAAREPKIKEAKAHVKEFEKLFPHLKFRILDLKLKYTFFIAELLSEFGGGDESWEDAMINMFEECCKQVSEDNLGEKYQRELLAICNKLNRNYCELLDEYYDEYFKK